MEKVDLNAFSNQEMNQQEMMEINGGAAGSLVKKGVEWLAKAIASGAAYDTVKSGVDTVVEIAKCYKYDSAANYSPWYGPGGGFK